MKFSRLPTAVSALIYLLLEPTPAQATSGEHPSHVLTVLSRGVNDTASQFTVGKIIPGLENVTEQAKLPAVVDSFLVQRWETTLDANGIIGPGGHQIPTLSAVTNTSQLRVVLDTAAEYSQIPQNVADAIYGHIPGAEFIPGDDDPGYWRYPCAYEVNLTFQFADTPYPIHPLDISFPDTGSNGTVLNCSATFRQISSATNDDQTLGAYDMVLGMPFLRNVYLLINFGDSDDDSNSSLTSPYMQLLSTTNPSTAHADFVTARLNGTDTTSSQTPLLSAVQQLSSQSSDAELINVGNTVKSVRKKLEIILPSIAGGLFVLTLLCTLCVCLCHPRRRTPRTPRETPGETPRETIALEAPATHP